MFFNDKYFKFFLKEIFDLILKKKCSKFTSINPTFSKLRCVKKLKFILLYISKGILQLINLNFLIVGNKLLKLTSFILQFLNIISSKFKLLHSFSNSSICFFSLSFELSIISYFLFLNINKFSENKSLIFLNTIFLIFNKSDSSIINFFSKKFFSSIFNIVKSFLFFLSNSLHLLFLSSKLLEFSFKILLLPSFSLILFFIL